MPQAAKAAHMAITVPVEVRALLIRGWLFRNSSETNIAPISGMKNMSMAL